MCNFARVAAPNYIPKYIPDIPKLSKFYFNLAGAINGEIL